MTRRAITAMLKIRVKMKRITKISVTLTRRRVIRVETAARPEPQMTPEAPRDVRATEQPPPVPRPTKPPC